MIVLAPLLTLSAAETQQNDYSPRPLSADVRHSEQFTDKGDCYVTNSGQRKCYIRSEERRVLFFKHNLLPSEEKYTKIASIARVVSKVTPLTNKQFSTFIEVHVPHDKAMDASVLRDSAVAFDSPLLKDKHKPGVLAVLPSILFRLNEFADLRHVTAKMKQFGPFRMTALSFSKVEFELQLDSELSDIGDIFDMTREVAGWDEIQWAEPNFIVAPRKNTFPNDPLYMYQWYLNNIGLNGSLPDADIDAAEGWRISLAENTVIAIFDDGVDMHHEDLLIWTNEGEFGNGRENNGIDDDRNGYVDDYRGWDFRNNDNTPSPSLSSDNHGTACAGVAGAITDNGIGIAGCAVGAMILPIRSGGMMPCSEWGNAIRYAGKYADVISNSWSITACYSEINSAVHDVVHGKITGARRGVKGTPIVFASGNSGSGWKRYQQPIDVKGHYTLKWKFSKDETDTDENGYDIPNGYDTVWLDHIIWPDGSTTDFETDTIGTVPAGFSSSGDQAWAVVSDAVHTFGASDGKAVKAGKIGNNQSSSISITKELTPGVISFWVWVSSEYSKSNDEDDPADYLEFQVDGKTIFRYAPGQFGYHKNEVEFPASNSDTIAVGSSNDGVDGMEQRAFYSQFGPEIDIVAPSNGGGEAVLTTDRTGVSGYNSVSAANGGNYVIDFGGTSASAPLVAGIIAEMIKHNDTLTAIEIREKIREGADKIGPYPYIGGRNDYFGYGRANLYNILSVLERSVAPTVTGGSDVPDSSDDAFCFIDSLLSSNVTRKSEAL